MRAEGSQLSISRDETTDRLGQLNGSDYDSSDHTGLWIAVVFGVLFLFVLIISMVFVIRRIMTNGSESLFLQRKLTDIEGYRLKIEIERLTIEKRRLEMDENNIAVSVA
ncbi:uncharacterized protein LOC134723269 [Mytilus trossulus]|uniref:uncharacterized protein LOC134723269 n=1 Tax=Mytilus trossulus TaxID=6551 RepID=UPI003007ECAC